MPLVRPNQIELVDAVAAVLAPLPRCGHPPVTDPVFTAREEEARARFGFLLGLCEEDGWVVESAGQEPRDRVCDGSEGNEHVFVTALTVWDPKRGGADVTSRVYFGRKLYEAEIAFEATANARLGLPGVLRHEFLVSAQGQFRTRTDTEKVVHVCEYDLRVFTRSG